MTEGSVRLSRDGHVAILLLDRPERRNALGEAMWSELEVRIGELERSLPRALVLTGAGDRAFCAGQDLGGDNPQVQSLVSAVQTHDESRARHCRCRRQPGSQLVERSPQPDRLEPQARKLPSTQETHQDVAHGVHASTADPPGVSPFGTVIGTEPSAR